ncbi:DUF6541 family protein [Corynebacterium sp. Q4381]|uniref:DUF6541 family protein n=1 Tax=Corynebacterium sp. Marseille-Q4381 TaxID=3121597 RepID=UPI002FE67D2D
MASTAALWFAIAFFLLPGFLIALVSGMRAPAAAAAALPVTFGVIGMSAWMWGLTSAPFNLWTYGVSLALALGAAAVWRFAIARTRERRPLDPAWMLPAAGVAAGAWLCTADRLHWLQRAPNGVYNVVQGWDSQWHANAVRFIMDTGVASPTRMGELQNIETQAVQLYPSGYHAGAALFGEAAGLDPIPALNIAQVVLSGIALPLTMACLVLAFLRSRGLTAQIAAAFAAVGVAGVPHVLWIAEYVGMWPYQFAMSLTGIVIWLFLTVPRDHVSALAAALGFLGLLCVHPSAVSVVVVAVALAWLTSLLVRPERSRLSDTLWLALPAVGASVVYLPQVLAGSKQASEVSGWVAQEALNDTDAWESSFFLLTRHVEEFFPDFDPMPLLWLGLIGAVVMLVWRGQIWPSLFYAVCLLTTVNSTAPLDGWVGDALWQISSLHYNTPHRLIIPVVMCLVASAAVALAAMVRLVTLAPLAARRENPTGVRVTAAASVVVAAGLTAVAVPSARASLDGANEHIFTAPRNDGRMVSQDDIAAFTWLASRPEAYEGLTIGDPSDGHSWLYAFSGVPTASRHYLWPNAGRGAAFDTTFWHPDFIGEGLRGRASADNPADEAVEKMNIRFYMVSPQSFWDGQRTNKEANLGLWASKGMTPVYRKGTVAIFAVNEAFTSAELADMRKDALANGSDELFELEAAGTTAASG